MANEAVDKNAETLGRYRLLKKIARGGMAEVYAARSYGAHGFEKTVAIKRILARYGRDPQFVRMMVDEAKISVLLNHPNIAAVLELGEQDGDYFIVMEFVPGQSLSALVKRMKEAGERMAVLDAAFVVVELLQGLHAAHTQRDPSGRPANIIHRDVSPQNVLISYDGHVKVIDFGIARAKDRLEATEIGTIKGKLRYLAPEMIDPTRFAKSGDFDHRVDVFAAGIVLFELIAGRTLFTGSNEVEVYEAITEGVIPDLSSERLCDPPLAKIVQRALTRRPDDRYPSAEAFADDLRAYLYRTDASYTGKRVASLLRKHFAAEYTAMQNLERAPDATVTVAADAKDIVLTRTHTPAMSRAPSERSARSDRSASVTAAAESTRAMRTGESGKVKPVPSQPNRRVVALDGVEPAPPDAATRMAEHPFADVDSAGKPSTVVTRKRKAEEPTRAVENPLIPPISQTQTSTDATEAVDGPDETPSTRGLRRPGDGRIAGKAPLPPRQPRSRVIAASAAIGVLLALGIVGLIESTRDDDDADVVVQGPDEPVDVGPTPITGTGDPAPVPAPAAKVPLLVAVSPMDAKVTWIGGGEPQPQPALFMVAPGTTVELVVGADGYAPKGERIEVGATQREQVRVEVTLDAMPVPVQAKVRPQGATVTLNGAPLTDDAKVAPGKPVVIEATAPGHRPFKDERVPEPATPFVLSIELQKRESDPRPNQRREAPAERGVLIITSAPYWGRVTIDGATLEETTPIRVTLKAGVHEVSVAHPPKGLEKRFKVTIKGGETVKRAVTF